MIFFSRRTNVRSDQKQLRRPLIFKRNMFRSKRGFLDGRLFCRRSFCLFVVANTLVFLAGISFSRIFLYIKESRHFFCFSSFSPLVLLFYTFFYVSKEEL